MLGKQRRNVLITEQRNKWTKIASEPDEILVYLNYIFACK
jgi:hypothetical protein